MNTEPHTQQENSSAQELDFIAIGDMVIDAFIRLNEDTRAHIEKKPDGTKEISMPFGEKVPFEYAEEVVAVGNSANAAVSSARLGLRTGLIVNIGDDENGKKCIAQLEREHIDTSFVKINAGKKTNYHYVLWYKDERTILIKHELFDYALPEIKNPRAIYLSSISENALPFHTTLADYIEAHPEIEFIFQPGTYQIKWGTEALSRIYKRTNIFFCNYEEAEKILKLEPREKTKEIIKELLDGLRALGPALPVVTDGPNGAYTYNCMDKVNTDSSAENFGSKRDINYNEIVFMPVYPDIAPPLERTGAGDAFASTFSVAYLQGKTVTESLKWASINSMNVCQRVGAQAGLLSAEKIQEYLTSAPTDFEAKII